MDEPIPIPKESWLFSVAGKKVSWAVAKLIIAKGSAPAVVWGWNHVTDVLKPLGIQITIDHDILSKALPGVIFAGLVMAHDYAKVRFGFKWL